MYDDSPCHISDAASAEMAWAIRILAQAALLKGHCRKLPANAHFVSYLECGMQGVLLLLAEDTGVAIAESGHKNAASKRNFLMTLLLCK